MDLTSTANEGGDTVGGDNAVAAIGRRRRWWIPAVVGVLIASLVTSLVAVPATDAASSDGQVRDVAVAGPIIRLFQFGGSVGLGLVCPTVAGLVTTALAEGGDGTAELADAVNGIATTCAEAGAEGAAHLDELRQAIEPLAVLNPPVDDTLEALASSIDLVVDTHGDQLSPFGPTLEAVADDLRFLQGG